MVERRRANHGLSKRTGKERFSRADEIGLQKSNIQPLGQILIAKGIMTEDLLNKVLDIHWRRAMPLGEVLKDAGIINNAQLNDMLHLQSFSQKTERPSNVS
jgi:hypothetical protein